MPPTAPTYSASSHLDASAFRAAILYCPEAPSFSSTSISSFSTAAPCCWVRSGFGSPADRNPPASDGSASPRHIRAAIAPMPAARKKARAARAAYNSTLTGGVLSLAQCDMLLPCSLILPTAFYTPRRNQNRPPEIATISVAGCTIGSLCPRCPSSGQQSQPLPINVVRSVAYTAFETGANNDVPRSTAKAIRSQRRKQAAQRRCRKREGRG